MLEYYHVSGHFTTQTWNAAKLRTRNLHRPSILDDGLLCTINHPAQASGQETLTLAMSYYLPRGGLHHPPRLRESCLLPPLHRIYYSAMAETLGSAALYHHF